MQELTTRTRWLGEAVLVVAVGATCVQQAYAVNEGRILTLDALIGVAATLSLMARRTWPWLTAVVVVFAAIWSGMVLPLMVMLFSFAMAGAVVWAAGAGIVALAGALVVDRSPNLWDARTLGPVAMLLCSVVLGLWVAGRRENIEAMRRQVDHLREERELRAERARLAERSRIAAEMHDVLGHRLSLVALHAGVLGTRTSEMSDAVAGRVELLRSTSADALDELREVLGVLRDPDRGPGEAVERTTLDVAGVVDQARAAGQNVELAVRGDDDALSAAQRLAVLRIVQEGLTNARKHSPGQSVDIAIDYLDTAAEVSVENPTGNTGGDTDGGFGLVGLAERVSTLDGRIVAGPHGDRWRIDATIPIGK